MIDSSKIKVPGFGEKRLRHQEKISVVVLYFQWELWTLELIWKEKFRNLRRNTNIGIIITATIRTSLNYYRYYYTKLHSCTYLKQNNTHSITLTCTIAWTFIVAIILYVIQLAFFSIVGGLDITSLFASSADFSASIMLVNILRQYCDSVMEAISRTSPCFHCWTKS